MGSVNSSLYTKTLSSFFASIFASFFDPFFASFVGASCCLSLFFSKPFWSSSSCCKRKLIVKLRKLESQSTRKKKNSCETTDKATPTCKRFWSSITILTVDGNESRLALSAVLSSILFMRRN